MDQTRREFIKNTSLAVGAIPFFSPVFQYPENSETAMQDNLGMIGLYGPWASKLVDDPPSLSFRNLQFNNLEDWRTEARTKCLEYLAAPPLAFDYQVKVVRQAEFDDLHIEWLSWQLPYGRPTEAILLKPANAGDKKLPGVLAFHDHGGNKYFGNEKITKTGVVQHPMMVEHQENYYGGKPWANELAKKGYVVLVPDAFTFGSRRVKYQDVSGFSWGPLNTDGKKDDDPGIQQNIDTYNEWAGHHEHIMAKSLFCAGTTWPGVFMAEDKIALDILSMRPDVDSHRLGCGGLSGGGLRTVYLAGLDDRIKCAIPMGFMTTWKDLLLYKCYTHTWMVYIPILPNFLDFPEILGLRAPLATLVQNNNEDQLFTLSEMHRADEMLQLVFTKAGNPSVYETRFYDGPHKFDLQMQQDAFAFFDTHLS